jgi:prophage antirepressor-like protein
MTIFSLAADMGLTCKSAIKKIAKAELNINYPYTDLEPEDVERLRPLFKKEALRRARIQAELPGLRAEPAPRVFQFDKFRVRILDREGTPWFIAKDVCDALKIKNASDAISRLDKDERGTIGISDSVNGHQLLILSESGLFSLLLRCQGATTEGTDAHRFRRWVTHEVLPTIRREGEYKGSAPKQPPKTTSRPVISAALAREYRLAAEHKLMSAGDFQFLIGLPALRLGGSPSPAEPRASEAEAAEAFKKLEELAGARS